MLVPETGPRHKFPIMGMGMDGESLCSPLCFLYNVLLYLFPFGVPALP